MSPECIGFLAVLKKEVLRFCKVIAQTVVAPFVNASLYLLVFGLSLSKVLSPAPGITYLEFLVPGLLALGAFNNSLQNSASSLMVSKFNGDLSDLRLVPLRSSTIALAYSLACLIRGGLVATIIFLVAEVFCFLQMGHWLLPVHGEVAICFLVIGSLFFGNLGIIAGFLAKSFDQISNLSMFIVLPLIYLGGVFFPISHLSEFWQRASAFNPLVYFIEGMRFGVLGVASVSVEFALLLSLGFLVISWFGAWYAVRVGSYQRF